MVAWFDNADNADKKAALSNGTNLYIIDKDVPDYWWSSVNQQYYQLETQKADLTKYDNLLGTNDISGLSEDGTVTGALVQQKENLDEVNTNLTADGTPFRFGKDSNGNYGYIIEDEAGADAVIPFRSIDYGKIYTLSKTTTSLTTGTSVSLAQALPKGKYIGGWASFWSSDGTIRAVNTGVKTGVSITKTKDTTKVEKIDGATAPIVVVDIAEDSDTITLSDVNNYYRAAAAFWVKIG